ncbi:Putative tetratricopeptide-like helical domain superfamily [Septoria linicola]|uniref:Tetratricopeptide-like helical domain superfamily n=1 Tax=Septoria linicola TaxID=215465 RepID=A0A9Q9EQ58_9PEZI|nr:Putative tetratricopeptide-like helical domain superfamily [Septoria linicola]
MAQLQKFFLNDNTTKRRLLAVDGMGGIGETQLCVEFVRRHRLRLKSVFRLDGSTKDSLEQSLEQCAGRTFANSLMPTRNMQSSTDCNNDVEPEDTAISRFMSWLSEEGNDQWFMIIHNLDRDWPNDADSHAYDYREYVPKADQGNILITTRLSTLRIERLRLGRSNEDQALQMLELHANRTFTMDEARPVLQKLDGLPLALVQAGAYLGNHPSIAEYCAEYERKWSKLMDMQGSSLEEHDSILTTWTMSRDQVQRRDPNAAGLLRIWAFLDHRDIWYDLLDSAWYGGLDSALEEWYYDLTDDETCFKRAINTLLAYSLVEVKDGKSWTMHPVLHAWNLHTCMSRPDRIVPYRMALASVAGVVSTDYELGERLLPHAQSLAKHDFLVCEYYVALHLGSFANILAHQGQDPKDCSRLYEHALALRQSRLSPGSRWTLETLTRLGEVRRTQGNFERAGRVLREALQASDSELGRNNYYNIGILALLGRIAHDREDYTA